MEPSTIVSILQIRSSRFLHLIVFAIDEAPTVFDKVLLTFQKTGPLQLFLQCRPSELSFRELAQRVLEGLFRIFEHPTGRGRREAKCKTNVAQMGGAGIVEEGEHQRVVLSRQTVRPPARTGACKTSNKPPSEGGWHVRAIPKLTSALCGTHFIVTRKRSQQIVEAASVKGHHC